MQVNRMKYNRLAATAMGLALLAPASTRASVPEKYTIQSVAKFGDKLGDTPVQADGGFEIGALNDTGQLVFGTFTPNGEAFFQYANGKFTPIVRTGQPSPTGRWPEGDIWQPVSMNQSGQAVFAMFGWSGGKWLGTFLWDAKTEQTTAVALADMPATGDLVFEQAGEARPAINNAGEIALPAIVKNGAGKVLGVGLFFRDRDGKLQAAALPGQPGPDGVPIFIGAGFPTLASINDSGRIAFLARRQGQSQASAYVWEKGELTPVVTAGTQVAAGKIVEVAGAWVNNQNRTVLVDVILDTPARGLHALYQWDGSELHQVAVPGQAMPGGAQFATMPWLSMSFANDRGQHAFYARVTEGNQSFLAAYLMDTDGTLSLVLKTGDETELGRVVRIGEGVGLGVGLNNQGQVALPIRTDRFHLALLTPAAPAPAAGD